MAPILGMERPPVATMSDGGAKFGGIRAEDEFGGTLNFGDAGVEEDLDVGGAAFGFEEVE